MRKTTAFQQKRRRAITLGVIIAVISVAYVLIKPPAGYALRPPTGSYASIQWKALQAGQWRVKQKPVVVDAVRQLNGKPVVLKGFLIPLHTPSASSDFFFSERPRGCYFCNPPSISEVVQVTVHGGKEIPFTDLPVTVYGKLKVASGAPTDDMLYSIDDATLTAGL